MNAVAPTVRESRRWYWWVLIMFLLGVLVGWLLAPRVPVKPCSADAIGRVSGNSSSSAGAQGQTSTGAGPGAPDKGSPGNMGKDMDRGTGPGRPAGESDTGGVGKTPIHPSGEDQGSDGHLDSKGSPIDVPAATRTVVPDFGKGVVNEAERSVLRASDFRYDRTGLPRYAQSVSTTGSTLSRDDGSAAYLSNVAIITTSRFEEVVDWYKAKLPAGWNAQVVGNVGALAQQVSVDNILKTLTAVTQNNGATPSNASPSPPSTSAPAKPLSVAMFSPPQNSVGDPSILIQQGTDGTVEIGLSRHGTDQ